jgi:hypothetical protein
MGRKVNEKCQNVWSQAVKKVIDEKNSSFRDAVGKYIQYTRAKHEELKRRARTQKTHLSSSSHKHHHRRSLRSKAAAVPLAPAAVAQPPALNFKMGGEGEGEGEPVPPSEAEEAEMREMAADPAAPPAADPTTGPAAEAPAPADPAAPPAADPAAADPAALPPAADPAAAGGSRNRSQAKKTRGGCWGWPSSKKRSAKKK